MQYARPHRGAALGADLLLGRGLGRSLCLCTHHHPGRTLRLGCVAGTGGAGQGGAGPDRCGSSADAVGCGTRSIAYASHMVVLCIWCRISPAHSPAATRAGARDARCAREAIAALLQAAKGDQTLYKHVGMCTRPVRPNIAEMVRAGFRAKTAARVVVHTPPRMHASMRSGARLGS